MSDLKEVALGLIVKPILAFSDKAGSIISNPCQTGRQIAHITQWGILLRKGYREGVNFSRLLKRMYPRTGESSQLAVPRIDCLSDVEVDLLLQNSFDPDRIAAFFEDWFCTSGNLYLLAREVLQPECDLPEALAILYDAIDIEDAEYVGCAPLAAANLVLSRESVLECIHRFKDIFARKRATGEIGWASERIIEFPNVLNQRRFTKVPDQCLLDTNISLDSKTLDKSLGKMLAASVTENTAEIYYAGEEGAEVVRVDERGIFATNVEDFQGLVCNACWMRLMAVLMHKSLQIASSFPIVELSLTLMEAIAVPYNSSGISYSTGKGTTLRCYLSKEKHKLDSFISLLMLLMRMSRSIREGAESFARRDSLQGPAVLGLTFTEMREEKPMPTYLYKKRNDSLERIRTEFKRQDVHASSSSSSSTFSAVRHPATDRPFGTDGALDAVSEDLMNAMRAEVIRVQKAYKPNSKRRDVVSVSGSLWLDRIAKGKLLTSQRSRELTKLNKRKHVPQEMLSKREVSFYLPLYDRTVVFPQKEDVTNLRYGRLQVGSDADLTSVVSVLVATILWAGGQESDVVEVAIEADHCGTQKLIQFADGALGAELRKMLIAKEEGDLKLTDLVSCVHSKIEGPRDNDWVVREVLSLVVRHGIVCSKESARAGAYLKVMEKVRSSNCDRRRLIDADMPVSLRGVTVRQVMEFNKKGLEFIIIDDSLDEAYEVTVQPFSGTTEDSVSKALLWKRKKETSIVVHIEADNRRRRVIQGSSYGTFGNVSCQ